MSKHIFWIASYPKSGNTIIRALISSLFFSKEGLFDFKMLKNIPIIEDTINLEFIKESSAKDYKNIHELETLSKYWINIQSKKNLGFEGDFMFVKTHHALVKIHNNPFTTQDNTRGIIYVVRDPRDVALSMCNHFNFSTIKSVESLINPNFNVIWKDTHKLYLNKKKPITCISSWENHYLSWCEKSFNCPKLIIKFEDIIYKKKEVINKLIEFFNKNYNFTFKNLDKKIPNIINQTSFENLKQKEQDLGFHEAVNNNFFNKGKNNQWKEGLTEKEVHTLEKNFYKTLKNLKYKTAHYKQPVSK